MNTCQISPALTSRLTSNQRTSCFSMCRCQRSTLYHDLLGLLAICFLEKWPQQQKFQFTRSRHTNATYLLFISSLHMHKFLCLIDTGTVLNFVGTARILSEWNYLDRHRRMRNLRIVTQQPLHMDGKIPLHVSFCALYIRVWLGIIPNLAAKVVLGTSFIDRFISGIFPLVQKAVPWHSHVGPIYISSMTSKSSNLTPAVVNTLIGDTHKIDISNEEMPAPIRMARQALLQPQTDCHEINSTPTSCINIVEHRVLK